MVQSSTIMPEDSKITVFIVVVALIVCMMPVAALAAAQDYVINEINLNDVQCFAIGQQCGNVKISNTAKASDGISTENGATNTQLTDCVWYKDVDSEWVQMAATDTFEADTLYKVNAKITAKDNPHNYVFENTWTGTINNNCTSIISTTSNVVITTEKTMTLDILFNTLVGKTYTIYKGSCKNCTVTTDKTEASAGATVTMTTTCDEGYTLTASDFKISSFGAAVTVNGTDDPAKFTFTMPESNVSISATAKANQPTPTPTPAVVSTVIIEGANGTHKIGTGTAHIIKATCATDLFQNLNVDGASVDNSKYDVAKAGSLLTITLHGDYLDTLAAGKHTISLVFTDTKLNADTTLTVTGKTVPKTGDAENLGMYIMIMLVAAGIIITVTAARKRSASK